MYESFDASYNVFFESFNSLDLSGNQDVYYRESIPRYNSVNLEFFDLNYDNKTVNTEKIIKHNDKNTYFKNVHLFIDQIKNMANSRDGQFVRDNLWLNLRDNALS